MVLLEKGLFLNSNIQIKKQLMKSFLTFDLEFDGFLQNFIYEKLFTILNNQQFYSDVNSEVDSRQYLELEHFFVKHLNKLHQVLYFLHSYLLLL